MDWNVTGVTADLTQNQGTVVFGKPGRIIPLASISVTFQLGQPPPQSVAQQALIDQAKQILIEAGNSSAEVEVEVEV